MTEMGSVAVVIEDIVSAFVEELRDGDSCPTGGLGGSAAPLLIDPAFELGVLRFPLTAIAPL